MITVEGVLRCDMPGCKRVTQCLLVLTPPGLGGVFGMTSSAIRAVHIVGSDGQLQPKSGWRFSGLLGDAAVCDQHTDDDVERQAEVEREANRASHRRERERERAGSAKEPTK